MALAGLMTSGALVGCASLDEQQRKWIFQPTPAELRAEADRPNAAMACAMCGSTTSPRRRPARCACMRCGPNRPSPRAPLLLYLHGARRNIEGSAFRIEQMRQLGFSVLAVDYRGFGQSTNELPSEEAVVEDAQAAWDWLAKHHPGRPRYIFGHSLGGAIAVQLARQTPDELGLIVEGTFTSIPEVFKTFKWGWLPVTPLITQRFDSAASIAQVGSPVLVVHGSRDGLIRPELGRKLFEQAAEPKRWVLVEGGTHYSTNRVGQAQYREALRELFGLGQKAVAMGQ